MAVPGTLQALVIGIVVLALTFNTSEGTTTVSATTQNSTVLGSTLTTENATGSTPQLTSVVTPNTSTSAPNSSLSTAPDTTAANATTAQVTTAQVTSAHVTTEEFTPHVSILPANKTSTPRPTGSPPSTTTSKPGFDSASFGGGIAAGMGIFLVLVFCGVLIVTFKRRMNGPKYEVL